MGTGGSLTWRPQTGQGNLANKRIKLQKTYCQFIHISLKTAGAAQSLNFTINLQYQQAIIQEM